MQLKISKELLLPVDTATQSMGMLANFGTYSAYKTDLKTAQLIIVAQGRVAANKETLFL